MCVYVVCMYVVCVVCAHVGGLCCECVSVCYASCALYMAGSGIFVYSVCPVMCVICVCVCEEMWYVWCICWILYGMCVYVWYVCV